MIRNFRTLGLALVAVFAFSAVVASAASAQTPGHLTSTGPVTLTGTETGLNPTNPGGPDQTYDNALTGPLGTVYCTHTTYTGHAVLTHEQTTTGDKHALIPSGSTTATITPVYTSCHAQIPILGSRPATVTLNGCDYVFHIGETTGGGETYGVTADVKCPPGKKIEVHIYKSGSVTHPDADSICTIKVGEENNQGVGGLHLTNTPTPTPDDIDLTGTVADIHTENTGSLCGNGTSETADLDVDVTVKGDNAEGNPTNITITH